GQDGIDGQDGQDAPVFVPDASIPDYVKRLVDEYSTGTIDPQVQFPLQDTFTDTIRTIEGVSWNIVVGWLDPLDREGTIFWGSNNDYIAYIGDGFEFGVTDGPQVAGSSTSGWIWSNFEYISNSYPAVGAAPSGQNLTLALWMEQRGELTFDVTDDAGWDQAAVDVFVERAREMHGGAWIRVVKDPQSKEWALDLRADNQRYDSSSDTQVLITGIGGYDNRADITDDAGNALPNGVVPGITADCSGGLSPWGTIITAEENAQGYYGDLEEGYDSQFLDPNGTHNFIAGGNVLLDVTADRSGRFGRHSDDNIGNTPRDVFGYLVEIDPGVAPSEYYGSVTPGQGHQKLGNMGRARWENAAFVMDTDFNLIDGEPVVIYGGNDRRSGRVYKWVSSQVYMSSMTKAQVRDLLADGTNYVAHFADMDNDSGFTVGGQQPIDQAGRRGTGVWIDLSVDSTDTPPNFGAPGLVNPNGVTTVGAALQDIEYNQIGGFPTDDDVYRALFTAANKIGVMETNRPEDIEWNPFDQLVYVAFTNNGDDTTLDDNGVLVQTRGAAQVATGGRRIAHRGSMITLREGNQASPGSSTTFE
ncbi:MAG: alkaline phosphatase PhoX, partial [Myxococcota bacterium]